MEDEILVSKIRARIKGEADYPYGILGFLIGLFARFYTQDDFLLTKAIMALPYKLAEFALNIFFGDNVLPFGYNMFYYYQGGWAFPLSSHIRLFGNFCNPSHNCLFYGCHYRLSLK